MDAKHLGGFIPSDQHSYTPWLWDFLIAEFKPRTLLDIGCGEGRAAHYFLEHGVDARGVDGSIDAKVATVLPADRFILHDFTLARLNTRQVDMIWSCEFVEHVEERYLENVLDTFVFGRMLAMTFAWPDQPGQHHVNCQGPQYWIDKLNEVGFDFLEAEVARSKAVPPDVMKQAYWGRSGLLFRRRF